MPTRAIRGRGTFFNPANRFESIEYEPDFEALEEGIAGPQTNYFRDASKSIVSYNDSPDLFFDASINPYRGCEHGCVYCYARPTHEYFGLSAGLDFETQIFVKENAPDLLYKHLSSQTWKPQIIAVSGATDCYQPIEKKLKITRECLETLRQFRNPCAIVTKNHLVTRDIDILQELAAFRCAGVFVSLSSMRDDLVGKMEPRTSRPKRRLQTIRELHQAGIPTGVLVAPIVPGLNDHEIPSVIKSAVEAGAQFATYILLRMPYAIKELFTGFLDKHYPTHKDKVIHRIQHIRGGKLNASEFGERFRGQGIFADQIERLFQTACRKHGINKSAPKLTNAHFRVPQTGPVQEMLWG